MDTITRTSSLVSRWRGSAIEPRLAQILFLGILLGAGAWLRDFSIRPAQVALTFACGLACQNLCERLAQRPVRSMRSAIITSFSVTLLLRAGCWWIHPIAVIAAVGSKSAHPVRGKHLFNPANFGVIFAMILLPGAWVSPGNGARVRAGRLDEWRAPLCRGARAAPTSVGFTRFYVGALALRVPCLGQRWAILTIS